MRYLVISSGVEIVADSGFMDEVHPGDYRAIPEDQPPPSSLPQVKMKYARKALAGISKLDAVQETIDAMQEPDRTMADIEWHYSDVVERNSPLVSALGAAIGLSESDIDALFAIASQMQLSA